MKNSKKIYLILLIIIVGFLGYWFLFKPYFDKKACNNEALNYSLDQGLLGAKGTKAGIEAATKRKQLYDAAYEYCLHSKGIGI